MPDPFVVGRADPAPVNDAGAAIARGPRTSLTTRASCVALALFTVACSAPKTPADTTGAVGSTSVTTVATTSDTARSSTDIAATAASADVTPANAGFAGPENLVYDSAADVFLVANVNGGPVSRDANGFVSRLDATGHVIARKWIDGSHAATRLDAPKGLAIHGDTLAIADVGVVRLFNRRTGAAIGAWQTTGNLLNDVSYAPDGTLWVTDTQGPDSVGAIYHFDRVGRATKVVAGPALDGPDGIVALADGGALYATFGANRLARYAPSGATTRVVTLPGAKVDGLRRLADGSYVVSSWDAKSVYRLTGDTTLHPILTGVTSPAGLAVDTRRLRLGVTSMNGNRLYLVPLH